MLTINDINCELIKVTFSYKNTVERITYVIPERFLKTVIILKYIYEQSEDFKVLISGSFKLETPEEIASFNKNNNINFLCFIEESIPDNFHTTYCLWNYIEDNFSRYRDIYYRLNSELPTTISAFKLSEIVYIVETGFKNSDFYKFQRF